MAEVASPQARNNQQSAVKDNAQFVVLGFWGGGIGLQDGSVACRITLDKTTVPLRQNQTLRQFECIARCRVPAMEFGQQVKAIGRFAPVTFTYEKKTAWGKSEGEKSGKEMLFEALSVEPVA